MSTAEQQTVAQMVATSGLRTAEDLLRTLSQGKHPLAHLITLARHVISTDTSTHPSLLHLTQISSTLVRKNERLADWLFSAMLRELKESKNTEGYRAYRDGRALGLLGDLVEGMCAQGAVEVRTVFRGLAMALFEGALRSGPTQDDGYVEAVGRLWTAVVERTADGVDDARAHGDQVARVLGLAIDRHFSAPSPQAKALLLDLALAAAAVLHDVCETSGTKRTVALVPDSLLAQLLRLAGSLPTDTEQSAKALAMLHVAAFPADATVQMAVLLADSAAGDQRPDANAHTATRLLTTTAHCMATHGDPQALAHYTDALPGLLQGFLRALAQTCPATGSQGNPSGHTVSPEDAGRAALAMFHKLRGMLPGGHTGLRAGVRLARVYYADSWFGSVGSVDTGGVRQGQMDELARWLEADVLPALDRGVEEQLGLAFDAACLAVDAGGPSALAPLGTQLFTALAHAPSAHEPAHRLLAHLAATTARMRTLDTLILQLSQAECPRAAENLLLEADVQRTLGRSVARHMPYAQAALVLAALAQELAKMAPGEKREAKKRKLGREVKGRAEMLAVMLANLAPAGLATAATDQQRAHYAQALQEAHHAAQQCFAVAARSVRWAWPLVHHTLVDVAQRTGHASSAWLASVLHPRAVETNVLGMAGDGDARAPPLCMLAALQSAAHWAATAAAAAAEDGRAEVERMVGRALGSSLRDARAWGPWDGRAAGISAENTCMAAWQLLAPRLPLASEFAGAQGVRLVADTMAARVFAGDHGALQDAGVFEIPGLRPVLPPALVRRACALADHHPALAKLAQDGERSGAEALALAVAAGPGPLPAEAAAPWDCAAQAMLRFPPAYWPADRLADILALALVADSLCPQSAAPRLLLTRLTARRPQAAHLLAPHAAHLHWATASIPSDRQRATRRLASTLAAALLQSGLQTAGHPACAAHTACRQMCSHLLHRHPVLALDALAAVAQAAAAANPRALRRNCPQPHEWLAWSRACTDAPSAMKECGPVDALVLRRGVRACMRTLRRCLADHVTDDEDGAEDEAALHVQKDADQVLSLALALDAVHAPGPLEPPSATRLLSQLGKHLHLALAHPTTTPTPPLLQAFSHCLTPAAKPTDSLPELITVHATHLLQRMDAGHFDRTLVGLLQLLAAGGASRATPRLLRACFAAGRSSAGEQEEKRRAVQRRVGAIVAALSAALHDAHGALEALDALADLVLDPKVRLTPNDVAQILALTSAASMLPGRPSHPSALFLAICRMLGALALHHAAALLPSLATLVAALRSLLHAFITPTALSPGPRSPWIIACAPLPVSCAEAYARVLSALARARRHHAREETQGLVRQDRGTRAAAMAGLVRQDRGTRAAAMAAALSPFVTHVLAEYCVVQAAGARSAVVHRPPARRLQDPAEMHVLGSLEFAGFAWRPMPVADPASAVPLCESTHAAQGIIASPALRDALLPGWYALLDVIHEADRAALLALLATDSRGAPVYGGSSVFGPDAYGGANEILKALYQSYRDFYKYKGNV
ncbi:hypothetical protein GGI15_000259 [Coemansia interrupta]|uniref:Nucleolar 27S pre-rRNA processing Urb2/Npa2 C-terminal domain-containing protein n=1 Tax=Coemansia interrupta TaxID=1126814 RepID=A0A9W8HM35_9FUNG|nr:hypothetical protein GGI15_000259 [Coemansia interrupta]